MDMASAPKGYPEQVGGGEPPFKKTVWSDTVP